MFTAHNVLPFWLKCSEKYKWHRLDLSVHTKRKHTLRIRRRKAAGYLREVILLKPPDRKGIIFALEHLDSNLKEQTGHEI